MESAQIRDRGGHDDMSTVYGSTNRPPKVNGHQDGGCTLFWAANRDLAAQQVARLRRARLAPVEALNK
jgi:hypothetical protein